MTCATATEGGQVVQSGTALHLRSNNSYAAILMPPAGVISVIATRECEAMAYGMTGVLNAGKLGGMTAWGHGPYRNRAVGLSGGRCRRFRLR